AGAGLRPRVDLATRSPDPTTGSGRGPRPGARRRAERPLMPFQNRVTPFGELVATPERGLVYGNRGRLHDEHGVIRRHWQVKRWISCRLEFRGRHRGGRPMAAEPYTGRV